MTRRNNVLTPFAVLLLLGSVLAAEPKVTYDISSSRADGFYRTGEPAVFIVAVRDAKTGEPVRTGDVIWSLDNFGSIRIAAGTNSLAAANPFTVTGSLATEGFLRLKVESGADKRVWSVGYDVEKIRQDAKRPADFDAYWAGEQARLERDVPLDPRVTRDERLSTDAGDVFRVSFATFGGKRVYGFLAVPKAARERPLPLRVSVPGAGPGVVGVGIDPARLTLMMNVHLFDPEPTVAEQDAHMKRANRDLALKYAMPNTNAYCGQVGISVSCEDYFYHDVLLGIDRAVTWAASRPDVAPRQVTYMGTSQGGYFGLALAYLNPRISRTAAMVPAATGHFAAAQRRQDSWPSLLDVQPSAQRAAAARHAAYFDGVNFAAGVKSPVRILAGLSDVTCPPHDVYAAFNACPSADKAIVGALGTPHNWSSTEEGRVAGERFRGWLARPVPAPGERKSVRMLPDEKWWGLSNAFGAEMPFDVKTSFSCDLRKSNYNHQALSLLVSDRGRILWCDEPVGVTIGGGTISVESDAGEIVVRDDIGATLADAYRFASRTWFAPTGEEPELLYFQVPQYNTWIELTYHQNEKDILAYAKSMLDHGLPPGILMIDDTWQRGYGVWEFESSRFSDPKGMVDALHGMGFKVVLWMCPWVSMDSPAYRLLGIGLSTETHLRQPIGGLLMNPAAAEDPAASKWWNGKSALLDLAHPRGRAWFDDELTRLVRDYGVDAFKFDGGSTGYYAEGFRCADPSLTPAAQARLYGDFALKYRGSEYRNVFGFAGKPVIMRLHDKDHSWTALRRLVPDMLAAGLIGTPFICPDMIGGGSWTAFLPGASFEPELFIRSAQVHALCPMMQISASPWRVLDARHQEVFRQVAVLRQRFAPEITALAKRAAKDGEPMMRNLEYAYPGCGYAAVKDEFLMGDDLLVAPVVEKGAQTRTVVIPSGCWCADDGMEIIGPTEIAIATPLGRLPYFRRISK